MTTDQKHAIQAAIDHAIVTHGLSIKPIDKNITTVAKRHGIIIDKLIFGLNSTGSYIARLTTTNNEVEEFIIF